MIKIDVDLNGKTIALQKSTHLIKMFRRYGMRNCRPVRTSINLGVANHCVTYNDKAEKSIIAWYQSAMRVFIWFSLHSHPDLANSRGIISLYCSNFNLTHYELVKYV